MFGGRPDNPQQDLKAARGTDRAEHPGSLSTCFGALHDSRNLCGRIVGISLTSNLDTRDRIRDTQYLDVRRYVRGNFLLLGCQ